jgi:hypothetical protein
VEGCGACVIVSSILLLLFGLTALSYFFLSNAAGSCILFSALMFTIASVLWMFGSKIDWLHNSQVQFLLLLDWLSFFACVRSLCCCAYLCGGYARDDEMR